METKITTADLGIIRLLYSSYQRAIQSNNGIAEIIVRDIVMDNTKSILKDKIFTNPSLDKIYDLHAEYGLLTLNYKSSND
jgi:hypothetical protein